MAMFREHIAIGAIISMIVVVAVYFYALITNPLLLAILFGVTIAGSFLPDVDSDSGMPFYLVFGTASIFATGIVLLYTLDSTFADDWRYVTGIPLAALAFFWFVVGGVLKKCTHHRGIFHSLPAMIIAGIAAFLIAERFGMSDLVSIVFGVAMAIGFASHLVLDELHSFVDLEGIPFIPKKSLGTALKLFSDSNRVNMATYVLLAALVYTALKAPAASAATFYNDSDVIGIEGSAPPEPEENVGAGSGDSESGGGAPAGSGLQSGDGFGSDNSVGSNDSGGSSSSGGASNDSGNLDDSGESSSGATDGGSIDTGEEVIDLLVKGGAINGEGVLSGSSLNGGQGGSSGSGFDISISGSKVRAALRGKYDLQQILQSWKGKKGQLNAREYGIIAASTALTDTNIDSVSFTASKFEITYRSRGYLFSIIPWSFPVRVAIVPEARSGERVMVHLPWYRFFVREFFTSAGLSREIEDVLSEEGKKDVVDEDMNARLFEVVADFLKRKVGTISDTIYLGVQQ